MGEEECDFVLDFDAGVHDWTWGDNEWRVKSVNEQKRKGQEKGEGERLLGWYQFPHSDV